MMVVKIKKQKAQKCAIQRKLNFEDYKHCLEAAQQGNKTNQLEKNKVNIDGLKENHKEFI